MTLCGTDTISLQMSAERKVGQGRLKLLSLLWDTFLVFCKSVLGNKKLSPHNLVHKESSPSYVSSFISLQFESSAVLPSSSIHLGSGRSSTISLRLPIPTVTTTPSPNGSLVERQQQLQAFETNVIVSGGGERGRMSTTPVRSPSRLTAVPEEEQVYRSLRA
jgi:hypothetical protein